MRDSGDGLGGYVVTDDEIAYERVPVIACPVCHGARVGVPFVYWCPETGDKVVRYRCYDCGTPAARPLTWMAYEECAQRWPEIDGV